MISCCFLISLLFVLTSASECTDEGIRFATYNILYSNCGGYYDYCECASSSPARYAAETVQPDVLGTQENGCQVDFGRDMGNPYEVVPYECQSCNHNAIYYNSERIVFGGVSGVENTRHRDNYSLRMYSWSLLQTQSGFAFWIFNVHNPHEHGNPYGFQANIAEQMINKYHEVSNGEPAVFTGDFNPHKDNNQWQRYAEENGLTKAGQSSGGVCGFCDQIYFTNGDFEVVSTEVHGRGGSDHNAYSAVLRPTQCGGSTPVTPPAPVTPGNDDVEDSTSSIKVVEWVGKDQCNQWSPCEEAKSDCDDDSDCAGDLICWQRSNGETKPGYDVSTINPDADVCVQPETDTESDEPTAQSQMKCWLFHSNGNGRCSEPENVWSEDIWGRDNQQTWDLEENCMGRKSGHDSYCGTDSSWCFTADPSECVTPSTDQSEPDAEGEPTTDSSQPCLCVFDIDRTLTAKQSASECTESTLIDGIYDTAYGGGPLRFSHLMMNIQETFCLEECHLGIVSAGTASGDDQKRRMLEQFGAPYTESPYAEGWHYGCDGSAPWILSCGGSKTRGVRSIMSWYQSQGVEIQDEDVYYFDDKAGEVSDFKTENFNAKQISCPPNNDPSMQGGKCGAVLSDATEKWSGVRFCDSCATECYDYDPNKSCQCNDLCVTFGNCCEDYEENCEDSDPISGKVITWVGKDSCTLESPCQDAESDCDEDGDCAGALVCWQRTFGESREGYDTSQIADDADVCVQPESTDQSEQDTDGEPTTDTDGEPTTDTDGESTTGSSQLTDSMSDEFNGNRVDESKWTVIRMNAAWKNNEKQCYVQQNTAVRDGNLVLTAGQRTGAPWENMDCGFQQYFSGSIEAKNYFLHGTVEVRAKLPSGDGLWPAIWLLGQGQTWPACGEIDLMEVANKDPMGSQATLHYGPPRGNSINLGFGRTPSVPLKNSFHTWKITRTSDLIVMYFDGVEFGRKTRKEVLDTNYPNAKTMFDAPMRLILNVAVGGGFTGIGNRPPNMATWDKTTMEVDYVRTWSDEPDNCMDKVVCGENACASCQDRIDWLMTSQGKTESEAKAQVESEFPNDCVCNSEIAAMSSRSDAGFQSSEPEGFVENYDDESRHEVTWLPTLFGILGGLALCTLFACVLHRYRLGKLNSMCESCAAPLLDYPPAQEGETRDSTNLELTL